MNLTDVAAERGVLAGIYKYGDAVFSDIEPIISERTFTLDSNIHIFKCFKHIIKNDNKAKLDVTSVYSAAHELGLEYWFKKAEEVHHLKAIMNMQVQPTNVNKFAAKIRKFEIARLLREQLAVVSDDLLDITGQETQGQIVGMAENMIFDFSSLVNNSDDDAPTTFFDDDTEDYLTYLADNPISQIGISTGMPKHDAATGGGLRNGGVHVFAARLKVGKSTISLNIGAHISEKLGIPVLYLDTEMMKKDQTHRVYALLTETDVTSIENGQFGQDMFSRKKVLNKVKEGKAKKIPFFYRDIAGKDFEDVLSLARRWIIREVGLNDDGTAKQCVVIYDYLKLMSTEGISGDIKEHQLLGFMMTGLVNFAKKYNIPVVTLAQTNRDGVNKETTDVIGGSDRIGQYCTSLSLLKMKSVEEMAASKGKNTGNRKLVVLATRYGPGMEVGDYFHINFDGAHAKITEGDRAFEVNKTDEDGFVVDESDNDEQEDIPFGD